MAPSATGRRLARVDTLLLTALLWFLAKFVRYAFPPLFESLRASYGVSNTALGAAFSGLMLVYAAMQFPSGLFADRIGPVRVIGAGATVSALAALLLVVDTPFVVLTLMMVLIGAGTGTHKTVAVRLLSDAYPSRTGRALGVLDTVGAFGGMAAPVAAVIVIGLPGVLGAPWRSLFMAAGLAGLVLTGLFVARVPSYRSRTGHGRSVETAGVRAQLATYTRLFRIPRFSAFVGLTILVAFAYNGAVAFLPLYLTSETGLSTATAGVLYSALFGASLVQLVTGEASDRLGTLPIVGATLAIAAVGLVVLVVLADTGNAIALGVGVVCLGLGAHGYRPVRGAYLMSVLPDAISGGGLGAVRTLLMGAGAIAPVLVGYLSETAGFRTAFWMLAVAMGGATVLTGILLLTGDDDGSQEGPHR